MIKVITSLFVICGIVCCKKSPPSKADVIREGNRRGMNLVDLSPFEESSNAGKYLVHQLASSDSVNPFLYRFIDIYKDNKSVFLSILDGDLESETFLKAYEDTFDRHKIDRLVILDEATAIQKEGQLKYQGREYRIEDGKLVNISIGWYRPSMFSETFQSANNSCHTTSNKAQ